MIKVWQRERIQDTFDTSGRANLERKSAWELFSWRWSSSKILDHGGRGCRSRLTICQLIQFYTNSEAALLSTHVNPLFSLATSSHSSPLTWSKLQLAAPTSPFGLVFSLLFVISDGLGRHGSMQWATWLSLLSIIQGCTGQPFLSPSGDLGFGLVWYNLSPPHHILVRLLKSSSNWTKLSLGGPQLFSGWYQMILDVFQCSQQFSDCFPTVIRRCFPTVEILFKLN